VAIALPKTLVALVNWLVLSFCGVAVVLLGLLPGLLK